MYCLRCGRDTTEDHVFCDLCQQDMEAYPVKPGTPVHLPHRQDPAPVKKHARRKRQITPEEQISLLKKSLRQARTFLVILAFVLCLAVGMLLYETLQQDGPIIGQNYTIDTTQQTD